MSSVRYRESDLLAFADGLLQKVGVRDDIAHDVADILVTGDLLGHTTHGLNLLPFYLDELVHGRMSKAGEPTIVNRRAGVQTWDGGRLPGPWLTLRGLEVAADLAVECGSGIVVIRRAHHIACLAAYLPRFTERGLVPIIQSSDPALAAVVPHGGLTPVLMPNPIAAGLPSTGDPILVDISTSATSVGVARQQMAAGRRLPGRWIVQSDGEVTDDPGALFDERKGAVLPLGGVDSGYKGFALGLLVEALTAGLAAFGRADAAEGTGATLFLQVLDAEAFGGLDEFKRQIDHVVQASRASRPRVQNQAVRMPGEAGLACMRAQLADGVELYPSIMPALEPWAARLDVPLPGGV